ncbi:MAG: SDR family oxidoreductase [Terriglobus roseus]|nr:SDR family oxidoreductase [Terriglobus roseus]
MTIEKRHILLTGAARGIGRCLARTLLKSGNKVFLLDVLEDELRYTAEVHLKQYHDRLRYAVCNLRDVAAIRGAVKDAADFFGGHIDVVVNNGSIASPKWKDGLTMEDPATLDQWQAYVETNLTAPFALAQACLPHMKHAAQCQRSGGAGPTVILVGSSRALQSDPNQEGYAATKAGQLGLMHSMAISFSQWGIRVNLVAPGRVKAMYECREGDEAGTTWADLNDEKDVSDHPSNRSGKPEDIADAVEFLIDAGFVNGQDITVDGGTTKKKNS